MKVLDDKVVFKFLDDISGSAFTGSKTSWGFMIKDPPSEVKIARWGQVVAVGPKATEVEPGDYVLIEPLMWTNKIKMGDDSFVWATDINKVMVVTKDRPKETI